MKVKTYTAVVEHCRDTGLYAGYVPGFPGAHSRASTLDEVNKNLQEVVEMLLEDGEPKLETEFVREMRDRALKHNFRARPKWRLSAQSRIFEVSIFSRRDAEDAKNTTENLGELCALA